MAADSKRTWAKGVALLLFYAVMGSLVFWGFGWSALKSFVAWTAKAFGLGVLAMVAIGLLLVVIAVLVLLLSGMLTSRQVKRTS